MTHDISAKGDALIGTLAATTPWWLPHFDSTIHVLLALGGLALLGLRIGIAWKEWRNKKRGE